MTTVEDQLRTLYQQVEPNPPVDPLPAIVRRSRRRRLTNAVASAVVLVVTAAAVGWVLSGSRERAPLPFASWPTRSLGEGAPFADAAAEAWRAQAPADERPVGTPHVLLLDASGGIRAALLEAHDGRGTARLALIAADQGDPVRPESFALVESVVAPATPPTVLSVALPVRAFRASEVAGPAGGGRLWLLGDPSSATEIEALYSVLDLELAQAIGPASPRFLQPANQFLGRVDIGSLDPRRIRLSSAAGPRIPRMSPVLMNGVSREPAERIDLSRVPPPVWPARGNGDVDLDQAARHWQLVNAVNEVVVRPLWTGSTPDGTRLLVAEFITASDAPPVVGLYQEPQGDITQARLSMDVHATLAPTEAFAVVSGYDNSGLYLLVVGPPITDTVVVDGVRHEAPDGVLLLTRGPSVRRQPAVTVEGFDAQGRSLFRREAWSS